MSNETPHPDDIAGKDPTAFYGNTLLLGFECQQLPSWKEFMPEPKAPSNYKDPDKIRDYVEAAWKKLEVEASNRPLTGFVRKAVVLRCDGELLFSDTGVKTYEWLSQHIGARFMRAEEELPLQFFGLNIRSRLHLCAVGAALIASYTNADAKPFESWGLYADTVVSTPPAVRNTVQFYDPVRLVTGSDGDYDACRLALEKALAGDVGVAEERRGEGAIGDARFVQVLVNTFKLGSPLGM